MYPAKTFVAEGVGHGFDFYTGVPCSFLKPLINFTINSPDLFYLAAANEGDAVAMAAGAYLAGKKPVVIFQNSGLGNAVNPLASLAHPFKIPMVIVVTLRGEPGGKPDEPQHELMGLMTTGLLDSLRIGWEYFPESAEAVPAAWRRARHAVDAEKKCYGFVMRRDTLEPEKLCRGLRVGQNRPAALVVERYGMVSRPSRAEALERIQGITSGGKWAIIASTGYPSRELYALEDRADQFYMVGSMGCASSIGLGVAVARPSRPVAVIEGDGAVLMRLGAMATIGAYAPSNLIHVILDNEAHESTGSQETVSAGIRFAGLAESLGYARIYSGEDPALLDEAFASVGGGLTLAHLKIRVGASASLPRPSVTPAQVAERFAGHLRGGTAA